MKKILFITHNASLTGAPYVLLLFLKWLKNEHKEIKVDIVFLEKGELYNDFIDLANTSYDYTDVKAKKKDLREDNFVKKNCSK